LSERKLDLLVIPAQARIQYCDLDSRLRGNDEKKSDVDDEFSRHPDELR
jgi:hypothetical protein